MTAATRLARPPAADPAVAPVADAPDLPCGIDLDTRAPVLVQGPGGSGKTFLLGRLADAHRRAGRRVLQVRTAPDPAGITEETVVLADDAHRLGADPLARLGELLQHPAVRVVLAYRPWPRPPALRALVEELSGERHLVLLDHLDRNAVARWARVSLGEAAAPAVVDAILAQTGGLPSLVDDFLEALAAEPARNRPGLRPVVLPFDPTGPIDVPAAARRRLHGRLAALDDVTRTLVQAMAAGAPLDGELVSELLGLPVAAGADAVSRARASGFLSPRGALLPAVRTALLESMPADLTRSLRRRLLELLLDRGDDALQVARALAADGTRDARAARVLSDRAGAALPTDPSLAGELFGAAVRCGAPERDLAASRAEAAALAGDLDAALRLADTVLADRATPGWPRAAAVAAAVLTRRGLIERGADLYRAAGPERSGAAALGLLVTGDLPGARAVLEAARGTDPRGFPTMLAGTEELMARGVLESLCADGDTGAGAAGALSTLTRAAALLEPVGRTAMLIDTPAALAALVALQSGELAVAESGLRRALDTGAGGRPGRPRHLLLLAWVEMLRGHAGSARELMAEARHSAGRAVEPRDDLFLQALEVGLARRSSDVPALVAAWARAREAVLRHPVELLALLPLGELMVAAARLGDRDRLAPHVTAAQALLDRLGEPQLWATPLHWSGVQAAILTDDPAGLRPHASALVAASRTSPYAAVLARAGRSWLRVLTGDVDAASVVTAAEQLAGLGLAWDGSRLAGQAAVRTADPRARTQLLGCARALAEAHGVDRSAGSAAPGGERTAPPEAGGQLSDREREVARLVLDGRTYREIGGQLYISAKTVEHHVSRMRQRLGAGTRSDLLSRLRAELAEVPEPRSGSRGPGRARVGAPAAGPTPRARRQGVSG